MRFIRAAEKPEITDKSQVEGGVGIEEAARGTRWHNDLTVVCQHPAFSCIGERLDFLWRDSNP